MLTGPAPDREWLLQPLGDEWEAGRVYLDADLPAASYTHRTGMTVELRRAAEWFGDGDYSAADAESAWHATHRALNGSGQSAAVMFRSPGATGIDLWLRMVHGEAPDPLSDELQQLIRSTSPQHRIELMPNRSRETMPAAWVLDGRWMYAALTRELGTGPALQLTGEQAEQHALNPYARARYRVRFAAPSWWESQAMPGIIMAKAGELAADGWHAPLAGEAWLDAAELHLARRWEWQCDVLEGIAFAAGRPLDSWGARLIRARERASDELLGEAIAPLVRSAIRSVMLHAIGSFHSGGRSETMVTASPMTLPDGEGWGAPERMSDGRAMWRRASQVPSARAASLRHPEWSAAVWGRAHARILESPTRAERHAGALYVPPLELASIYGDAIMTTRRPGWADLDDGKPGRLRVKGHLCGPIAWPTTARERDEIVRAASAAGTTCTKGCE
jgi:hypothetical protein